MKPAIPLWYLKVCDFENIPAVKGVLVIVCEAPNTHKLLHHSVSTDIRETAIERASALKLQCGGNLLFWICTDEIKYGWEEAEKLAKHSEGQ